jgi:hypothetical protein
MITERKEYKCDRCLKTAIDPHVGEFGTIQVDGVGKNVRNKTAGTCALEPVMHLCIDCARDFHRFVMNFDAEARPGGAEAIAVERQRQLDIKDWTPDHDDEHKDEQLLAAAICYALNKAENHKGRIITGFEEEGSYFVFTKVRRSAPPIWPWEPEFDKRETTDRLRSLAKAGALIAAEYDRLQRLADKEAKDTPGCHAWGNT